MSRAGPLNLITDVAGLKVGQAEDAAVRTGVTVLLPDDRAVCAVDVRGGAPGTRETDALAADTLVEAVDAIVLAGGSVYGLAAAVWTRDMNIAHRISGALRAGTVWVNSFDRSSLATPFGGFKQSGFGRDRSAHAIDKYVDLKTIWTAYR